MKTLLFLSFSAIFAGCYTCPQCHLTMSKSFEPHKQLSVLVLPVTAHGNPDVKLLPNYSDDLSTALLEIGYNVVDRSAAEREATRLGIDLTKGIAEKDVQQLAEAIHVDAVLLSSVSYAFKPAESGTTPLVVNTSTDTSGRVEKVSMKGPSSYQRSEQYVMTSMSLRLVEAKTMFTLVSAYTEPRFPKGVNTWMVEMLKEKLSD